MEKHYEFIEEEFDDFLDGAWTAEQQAAFEARLVADPTLRKELAFHQAVRAGLQELPEMAQRKREIGEIGKRALRARRRRLGWKVLLGAATLLLFVTAGVWYLWPRLVPVPVPFLNNDTKMKFDSIYPRTAPPPVVDSKPSDSAKSVSPIVSGKKSAKVEPIDDIKAGAANSSKVETGSIPMKTLVVRDGKIIRKITAHPVQVELAPDKFSEPRCRFFVGKLKIFTARPDGFSLASLEISELRGTDGSARFFLKAGSTWYEIFLKGKTTILQPEKNENLLRLLNEN